MDPNDAKMQELMKHFDSDVTYPATKEDIVKACNDMSDVPEDDKKWVMEKLPDGTYQNADEVKMAMGMGAGMES